MLHCLFNSWMMEQKNSLLLQNCVHIAPLFLKLFSQHFFSLFDWYACLKLKHCCYSDFSFFLQLYRVKYLKYLRTRKCSLEHKCEWNLSLVWLFLAVVTLYLNCLDRVVLAHPFWTLATFPVCFSVLSCWTNRAPSMGTKWSSWIWKKHTICKKQYMCWVILFCVSRTWMNK
jgi:hypothetical protein